MTVARNIVASGVIGSRALRSYKAGMNAIAPHGRNRAGLFAPELPVPASLAALARLIAPRLAGTETAISAHDGGADWGALVRLAERHRVVPALAVAAAGLNQAPPEPLSARLSALAQQAAFEELALAATTREIIGVLELRGIGCIVLKGVPLSLMIHGRLGMRTSRDIDILVAPRDAPAALVVLEAMGFYRRDAEAALPELMRLRKDVELLHDGRRQIVELHWRLFDNPCLLPLLPDMVPGRVALASGAQCAVLPGRLNLLYLANHGAQHGWSRLKWLVDLAGLLSPMGENGIATLYEGISWAEGRRSMAQALLLSGALFGWPVPGAVARDAGQDWRIRALVHIGMRVLAGSGEREIEAVSFGTTRKNISHYLIRSSPRYLWSELIFDLHDVSGMPQGSRWRKWGAVGRMAGWITRAGKRHG